MTVTEEPEAGLSPEGNPIGFGRMLRKEDARLVRGMGQFCDDIVLPGMLHMAILRSPVAHARIVNIDKSAAEALPKVVAVVTGEDLAAHNLAWMPTLSNDVQAVLATDKVRFQHQEVAFVVAEDKYTARDALELIDVEYDVLDAVMDVRKSMDAETLIIRDDLDGKADNHIFDWEAGDAAETDAVFARPMSWSAKRSSIHECIPRRWKHAAVWPTSSGCRASSPCGAPPKRRTPTGPSMPLWPACPSTRSG